MWKLLKIPEIKAFNEDMLMLVIEDSAYAQHVPIQLGTLYVDRDQDLISEKEITQAQNDDKVKKHHY